MKNGWRMRAAALAAMGVASCINADDGVKQQTAEIRGCGVVNRSGGTV